MKQLFITMLVALGALIRWISLKLAILRANTMSLSDNGRRYYVFRIGYRHVVVSARQFAEYNRHGNKNKYHIDKRLKDAVYITR